MVRDTQDDLGEQAARAAQWRLGGSIVSAVAQFTVGAVLARLLLPADFGLVALAFVVLGLANLFADLGLGSVIVQRQALSPQEIRAAFTVSILLGLILTLLTFATAPLIAKIMGNPQLTPVLQVLSLSFAFRGFGIVAGALLRRGLDYKRLFYIEFSSYVFGYASLGLVLAGAGLGVWSLVFGGLAQAFLATAMLVIVSRHDLKPLFALGLFNPMLGTGAGFTLSAFANYLALNGDTLLIGRFLGPTSLGLYSRAYGLMNLPLTYTASVMSGVLFPAFSQVQSDRARLRRGYVLASRLTALSAAPMMAGMIVAAPHLIRGIYGPNWEGTVRPLQILCVAGYFRAMYHLGGSVSHATGNIFRELRAQLEYATLVVIGATLGLHTGISGVAAGVSLAIFYMYWRMGRLALEICQLKWSEYIRAQALGVLLGAALAIAAFAARVAMEVFGMQSFMIGAVLVIICGLVWAGSLLLIIGQPGYEIVRVRLPSAIQVYVAKIDRFAQARIR